MRVRLKLAWSSWSKGHVFTDMPAGQAKVLVARGLAEYCDEQVKAAPVNRALNAAKPKRRPQAA